MIKIMVDSASDCRDQTNLYDYFIPLNIQIGGRDYKDGVDLDPDTFYKLLTTSGEFPKTSQPSPEAFLSAYEGEEILVLTVSAA